MLKADVPAGAVVTTGQSVVQVTAGEPLLRIEVPEAAGRSMRPGDIVQIDPADLPGVTAAAITQVYPSVTAGRVTADIKAAGLRADLVGQRVRVRIHAGDRSAIILPRRFVATRYGIDYVRVLDHAGKVSEVAVQTAPRSDPATLEVLSGLTEGDVVLAGAGQ